MLITVDSSTAKTHTRAFALINDLLKRRRTRQGICVWIAQFSEISVAFRGWEKNARTLLTDALQDGEGVLEKSGMENWKMKLHIAEVTRTIVKFFTTSC